PPLRIFRKTIPLSTHRPTTSAPTILFLLLLPPPRSTLFPYTTLFRSVRGAADRSALRLGGEQPPGIGMLRILEDLGGRPLLDDLDRKSTRLNSSHVKISYAVFCLKKKKTTHRARPRRRATTHTSHKLN